MLLFFLPRPKITLRFAFPEPFFHWVLCLWILALLLYPTSNICVEAFSWNFKRLIFVTYEFVFIISGAYGVCETDGTITKCKTEEKAICDKSVSLKAEIISCDATVKLELYGLGEKPFIYTINQDLDTGLGHVSCSGERLAIKAQMRSDNDKYRLKVR